MKLAVAERLITGAAEGVPGMVLQSNWDTGPIRRCADADAVYGLLRPRLVARVVFSAEALTSEDPAKYVYTEIRTAMAAYAKELRVLADQLEAMP